VKPTVSYAILAIGELGSMGLLALESIHKLGYSEIHAMADAPGKEWLLESFKDKEVSFKFYELPEAIGMTLHSFGNDKYTKFGESKFFQLMYLKWILISSVLQSDSLSDYVVFTDLDVLWGRSIEDCLDRVFSDENINLAGQLDWNTKSSQTSNYLCPGIMIWKKSESSVTMLKDIRSFHELKLRQDINFPDDKAINEWIRQGENQKKVTFLLPSEFVIGHRILDLLLHRSDFEVLKFRAFHADYCTGASRKLFRMKLISTSRIFQPFRYVASVLIICEKVVLLLIRLSTKASTAWSSKKP